MTPSKTETLATRAKPLRVKVPKSKERALVREFGLDAASLTPEELEKRRNDLRALVKLGKTRGFLTQQEINDHLPEKLFDPEVLEATVKMLTDIGIAVYEQPPTPPTFLGAAAAAMPPPEKKPEEAQERGLPTSDPRVAPTPTPA